MSVKEGLPTWKRNELGHVRSELLEIRTQDRVLYDRALRAYEKTGMPAPLVVWAAKRAWAQGTPGDFASILMNHISDCYRRLPELVKRSLVI